MFNSKPIFERKKQFTKKDAERYLSLPKLNADRSIDDRYVRELIEKMNDGLFLTGHIVEAKQNGSLIGVNGQHQSTALLRANIDSITVMHAIYDCPTLTDAAALYRQLTSKARSASHCFAVEADAQGVQWPKALLPAIGTGLVIFDKGVSRHCTKDERCELIAREQAAGDFICSIMCPNGNWKVCTEYLFLKKGAVFAAMIATWKKNRTGATCFWEQVASGENLRRTDPARKLRDWILQTNVNFGKGTMGPRKADNHEILTRCIRAWNSYRTGKPTSLAVHRGKPIPKPV